MVEGYKRKLMSMMGMRRLITKNRRAKGKKA